jgi:hypothetical protein
MLCVSRQLFMNRFLSCLMALRAVDGLLPALRLPARCNCLTRLWLPDK